MVILPAVDIMDGKPVRLYKGDFSTAHQVAEGALKTALDFERQALSGYIWWILTVL